MNLPAALSADGRSNSLSPTFVVAPPERLLLAHRLVLAGLIATLMWKWSFFVGADQVYQRFPLSDDFFPPPLRSVVTLRFAFLLSVAMAILSLFAVSAGVRVVCGWAITLGVTTLCLHQGSYNDMTFATAWWTSVWSLWLVHRIEDADPALTLRRAAQLARAILSMILLGGAVGKWTAEYWSGEVLYDIYFVDRDYWVFNWLRQTLDPETLREVATWYSRKVVVIETVAGIGLWLLPPRLAAFAGVIVFASIALLSNFLLFSVLSCLIALSSVGFLVVDSDRTETPDRSER